MNTNHKAEAKSMEGGSVFEGVGAPHADGGSTFVFVNTAGPIQKNSSTMKAIRQHVMRDIGRSRRASEASRVSGPRATKPSSIPSSKPFSVPVVAGLDSFYASPLVERPAILPRCSYRGCSNQGFHFVPPSATILAHENSSRRSCLVYYCVVHWNSLEDNRGRQDQNEAQVLRTLFMAHSDRHVGRISRFGSARLDPFILYPVEMTSRVRRFVEYIFDDSQRRPIFYRDTLQFPLGLAGEASFYQILSNIARWLRLDRLYRNQYHIDNAVKYEFAEETFYQAKAYKLVNAMLAAGHATSDDAISAVGAMASLAHISQDVEGWKMHTNALKEMVRLRGGIQTISNQAVRTALYWIDINGSSSHDLKPLWPLPTQWYPLQRLPSPEGFIPRGTERIIEAWKIAFPLPQDEKFLSILTDVARFSNHLQVVERRTASTVYTDPVFFGSVINPMLIRLLSEKSTPDPRNLRAAPREATRLGLILFLTDIRRRFGLINLTCWAYIPKLIYTLRHTVWEQLGLLKLWVVFMGVLEADEEQHLTWLLEEWRRTLTEQGIVSPSEGEKILKDIMWVESITGKRYAERYERFWGHNKETTLRTRNEIDTIHP